MCKDNRKGGKCHVKKLDLSRTVYELTNEYPELVGIMAKLGFTEITKKPMLFSVGKNMTIPKGICVAWVMVKSWKLFVLILRMSSERSRLPKS